MVFKNREEAAGLLVERLSQYRGQNPLVLGIPRGAFPMAKAIAKALAGQLDVVLVHKLRASFQPELAVGAIDEAGNVYRRDTDVWVSPAELAREIEIQRDLLRERRHMYTLARGPIPATGRIVIIVDDGIATGASIVAAVRSIRAQKPQKIVVATAVAPPDSLRRVAAEADEVVCLHSPDMFFAVGEFFEDFSAVSDEAVIEALKEGRRSPTPA